MVAGNRRLELWAFVPGGLTYLLPSLYARQPYKPYKPMAMTQETSKSIAKTPEVTTILIMGTPKKIPSSGNPWAVVSEPYTAYIPNAI